MKTELEKIQDIGEWMISILGLSGAPIGVRLVPFNEERPPEAEVLEEHRYCQALMKGRYGKDVLLDKAGISCPAAASAFGFRSLPAGLQSGKGLVGFGIVSDEAVGKKMFENMPGLEPGQIQFLHLFPLNKAGQKPDVIVVEDEVEKLMWILLSFLHARGGERVQGSTAVLQATCVDSTIIPYLEERMNFGYGCYGCRDATDIGGNEAVLGFPLSMLPGIGAHLEFLGKKAIPTSRSKKAFRALQKETESGCSG
ncbi:MAG: DUF169 domain-containing protein [Desulfohalobiaceae bacterium]|nr:DUF169 domain-containing protein [Desulfohalobiaceae bacterium]